jgi:hypothetical protein
MTPPRWFYPLVAVCLVALTAAGVWRTLHVGRYVPAGGGILDTRTGQRCFTQLTGGELERVVCRDMSRAHLVDPFESVPSGSRSPTR